MGHEGGGAEARQKDLEEALLLQMDMQKRLHEQLEVIPCPLPHFVVNSVSGPLLVWKSTYEAEHLLPMSVGVCLLAAPISIPLERADKAGGSAFWNLSLVYWSHMVITLQ